MQEIFDGLLAFFAAVGMVAVVHILFRGRPYKRRAAGPPDLYLLLYAQGDSLPLPSADLNLSCAGHRLDARVIVIDSGLDPQRYSAVSACLRRYANVAFCTPDRLAEHLPPSDSSPPPSGAAP